MPETNASISSTEAGSQPALPVRNHSRAGYTGVVAILTLFMLHYFLYAPISEYLQLRLDRAAQLLGLVGLTFCFMLVHEWRFQRRYGAKKHGPAYHRGPLMMAKSVFYRYIAGLFTILLPYIVVTQHYYFQSDTFSTSRELYRYLLLLYLFAGAPYIYLTLRYRGQVRYEYNDYCMLIMLWFKQIRNFLAALLTGEQALRRKAGKLARNRRIRKVFLVILVNFFFLTLMARFLDTQYAGFTYRLDFVLSNEFDSVSFFKQYHNVYLLLFETLFLVDVSLAMIGYTVASRWLDNRTRSVDSTLYGWFVAVICYPPMNHGFAEQFIGYGNFGSYQLITSETALMIIMVIIFICYFIYVWATAALGLKFSNLTNRGIIDIGPYRYMRHPAYSMKNLAWWIDNTHVLTNVWATIALATWNVIYILRGLTEEMHLSKDKAYRAYKQRVRYRFIPGVI